MNIDEIIEEYKYEQNYIDKIYNKLLNHSVEILMGYYSFNDDQRHEMLHIVLKMKKFLPCFLNKFSFLKNFKCDFDFDVSESESDSGGIEHGMLDISFSKNNLYLNIRIFPHHHDNNWSKLCDALGIAIFFSIEKCVDGESVSILDDKFFGDLDEDKFEKLMNFPQEIE